MVLEYLIIEIRSLLRLLLDCDRPDAGQAPVSRIWLIVSGGPWERVAEPDHVTRRLPQGRGPPVGRGIAKSRAKSWARPIVVASLA